jgi:predicted aspartyl protease
MPTTDCGFGNPDELELYGPNISVEIGFDPRYEVGAGGPPSLASDRLPGLIDTGADESYIDASLASTLNLPVADRRELVVASGVVDTAVHLAQIYVPDLDATIYGQFASVNLTEGEQTHYALIGRTFLRHFNMAYDGRTGSVIISND